VDGAGNDADSEARCEGAGRDTVLLQAVEATGAERKLRLGVNSDRGEKCEDLQQRGDKHGARRLGRRHGLSGGGGGGASRCSVLRRWGRRDEKVAAGERADGREDGPWQGHGLARVVEKREAAAAAAESLLKRRRVCLDSRGRGRRCSGVTRREAGLGGCNVCLALRKSVLFVEVRLVERHLRLKRRGELLYDAFERVNARRKRLATGSRFHRSGGVGLTAVCRSGAVAGAKWVVGKDER
jgi:hypothetical protein